MGGRDQLREAIENAADIAKFPIPFTVLCSWTSLLECLRIYISQDLKKQLAAFVGVIIGTFKRGLWWRGMCCPQQAFAAQPGNGAIAVMSAFVLQEINDTAAEIRLVIVELAGLIVDRQTAVSAPAHICRVF